MPTRPIPNKPDWLIPGAKILVVRLNYSSRTRINQTTIDKVATHSFTVTGSPHRFRIRTLDRHEPGAWGASDYVFPLDSDEARKHIREARWEKRVDQASVAYQEWMRSSNDRERLTTAIAALQAVENDLKEQEEHAATTT